MGTNDHRCRLAGLTLGRSGDEENASGERGRCPRREIGPKGITIGLKGKPYTTKGKRPPLLAALEGLPAGEAEIEDAREAALGLDDLDGLTMRTT